LNDLFTVNEIEVLEHERRKFNKSQKKNKMLVRRKEIQEQIQLGTQLLEQEEKLHGEHDDMEKQLGEYTFGDLHQNLNELMVSYLCDISILPFSVLCSVMGKSIMMVAGEHGLNFSGDRLYFSHAKLKIFRKILLV